MISPDSRRWAMAMLTASTDRDPIRFELAREATQEDVEALADIAVGFLRIFAEDRKRCPGSVLVRMGLLVARGTS